MSLLVVINGQPAALILAALIGAMTLILNIISAYTLERGYLMWRLPRHGTTVTAVRTRPGGKAGTYRYTDHSGTSHLHHRQAYAPEIKISYDPNAPDTNVGVYPAPVRVLVALSSLLLWAATTGLIRLMIHIGRTI
ncbi:hypothetical protein ACFXD5_31500 [Streptomyces sp. NPDC059385]|uniref:hypothetical protein n=1 Tax=Streptomyces sp. NPDC059385 TaxID=3346817 RepID=UPI0036A83E89